jgi:hypothetical protein
LILVDPGIDGSDLDQLADDLDRLGIPVVRPVPSPRTASTKLAGYRRPSTVDGGPEWYASTAV